MAVGRKMPGDLGGTRKKAAPKKTVVRKSASIGNESAYRGGNRQDPISKLRRTIGNSAVGMNKEFAAKGFKPVQDQSINPFAKRVRKIRFDGMGLEPIPKKAAPVKKVSNKPIAAKKSARPSAAGSAALRKANPDAGRKMPVVKKAAPKKAAAPARKVSTRKPPAPKNYGKSSGGSRSTTRRASY